LTSQEIAGSGENTATLVLRHEDKAGAHISSRVPAVLSKSAGEDDKNTFTVDWIVNPNAERGKGVLELVGVAGDGRDLALLGEDGKPWKHQVEVGGELSVREEVQSKAVIDPRSGDESGIFRVSFKLASGTTTLPGAKLIARVTDAEDDVLLLAPVVEGKDDDGVYTGYHVSWVLPRDKAHAGTYKVDVFRESDRRRITAGTEHVPPFFSFSVPFDGPITSRLPLKSEFVVAALFGAAFVAVAVRKVEIEGNRRQKK